MPIIYMLILYLCLNNINNSPSFVYRQDGTNELSFILAKYNLFKYYCQPFS